MVGVRSWNVALHHVHSSVSFPCTLPAAQRTTDYPTPIAWPDTLAGGTCIAATLPDASILPPICSTFAVAARAPSTLTVMTTSILNLSFFCGSAMCRLWTSMDPLCRHSCAYTLSTLLFFCWLVCCSEPLATAPASSASLAPPPMHVCHTHNQRRFADLPFVFSLQLHGGKHRRDPRIKLGQHGAQYHNPHAEDQFPSASVHSHSGGE